MNKGFVVEFKVLIRSESPTKDLDAVRDLVGDIEGTLAAYSIGEKDYFVLKEIRWSE